MDYHAGFEDNSVYLEKLEQIAIKEADILILTSLYLWDLFAEKNSNSILVRNGCDFEYFNNCPEELPVYSNKTVGYIGAISSWFDAEIVCEIAKEFTEMDIILIGSTVGCKEVNLLKNQSNIQLLGELPYDKIVEHLYSFDICIMPFKISQLTLATNPVKVYEYLAAGKPVVSTSLPEVEIMRDVVYTAKNSEEFISKICDAFAENSLRLQEKRIAFAKNNSWKMRAELILNKVDGFLTAMPKVSIVVLTYNNLDITRKCLLSIEKWTSYKNVELIVVDNASSDETPEFIKGYSSDKFYVKKNIKFN